MHVFELKSGDFLVVSDSGVLTIVHGKPYAMTGHPGGAPGRLRHKPGGMGCIPMVIIFVVVCTMIAGTVVGAALIAASK